MTLARRICIPPGREAIPRVSVRIHRLFGGGTRLLRHLSTVTKTPFHKVGTHLLFQWTAGYPLSLSQRRKSLRPFRTSPLMCIRRTSLPWNLLTHDHTYFCEIKSPLRIKSATKYFYRNKKRVLWSKGLREWDWTSQTQKFDRFPAINFQNILNILSLIIYFCEIKSPLRIKSAIKCVNRNTKCEARGCATGIELAKHKNLIVFLSLW